METESDKLLESLTQAAGMAEFSGNELLLNDTGADNADGDDIAFSGVFQVGPNEGDTVTVGEATLKVLHCPGHTPGHVVFIYEPQKVAWVGDVIFAGSIGRTDFPMGNHDQLISSIRDKLFAEGDDITFIHGHGPNSTLGHERQTNPFVADSRYG